MKRRAAVAGLLSLMLLALVPATEAAALEELMQRLARVKSSKVEFVEKRYTVFLDKPMVVRGTLEFRAPDTMIKHSRTPIEERFVARGKRLSIERVEQGERVRHEATLDEFSFLAPLVQGLRATLAGDLKTLRKYYRIRFRGDVKRWELRLVPIVETEASDEEDPGFGNLVKEIRIQGRDDRIRSVEIFETTGDRSVMTIL